MSIATANQSLIKAYADHSYKHTTLVRHRGTVVAFAMDDEQRIYYSVLDLDQEDAGKGALDVNYWPGTPIVLTFPNEISQVGYGFAGATPMPIVARDGGKEPDEPDALGPDEIDPFLSTTARLTAPAPFQVLSDNQFIYVFRQSAAGDDGDMVYKLKNRGASASDAKDADDYVTDRSGDKVPLVNRALLVDRFVLAGSALKPKMEIRYKRSRNKSRPAGQKDSLGAKDMEGNYFFEPTQELDFVRNLRDGRFQVLLLPTQVSDLQRWQIFAHNSATQRIDSFNIERSTDGLFNTKGTRLYTSPETQYQSSVLQRRPGVCPFTKRALIPSLSKEGYAETALHFDGTDDRITTVGYNGISGGAARSIEAWIKTSSQAQAIVSWGASSNTKEWTFRIQGGTDHPGVLRVDVGGGHVLGTKAVNDGEWHHVACTLATSSSVKVEQVELYVDGVLDPHSSFTTQSVDTGNTSDLRIGTDFSNRYFNGQIDEVRLWNRARNPDEIRDERQYRLVGNESGLVGYWRFDEGAGAKVHDQTDNARVGTIDGATWVDSEAPIGDHPGMRRSSFTFSGRTIKSGISALLYYQQEEQQVGYGGEMKPMKHNARVMLALASGGADADGDATDKKYIATLDFAVSREGKLALIPDSVKLPSITNLESSNAHLTEISTLQSSAQSLGSEVSQLQDRIRILKDRPESELSGLITTVGIPSLCGTRTSLLKNTDLYEAKPERYSDTSTEIERGKGQIEILELATETSYVRRTDSFQPIRMRHSGAYHDPEPIVRAYRGSDCYIDKVKWHGSNPPKVGYVISHSESSSARSYEIEGHLKPRLGRKRQELANVKARLESLQGIQLGQAAFMPLIHLDRAGLSVQGGVLYFAHTQATPRLFDSATGKLALYFQGTNQQFFAAYFDTKTGRSVQQITQGSEVVNFLARTAGKESDEAKIVITDGSSSSDCTLTISNYDHGVIEIWSKLPRSPQKLSEIMNGRAGEKVYVGKVGATTGTVDSLTLAEKAHTNRALASGDILQIGDTKVTLRNAAANNAASIDIASTALEAAAGTAMYLLPYDYGNVTVKKLFALGAVQSAADPVDGLVLTSGSAQAVASGATLIVGANEVTTRQAVASGATKIPIQICNIAVDSGTTQVFRKDSVGNLGKTFSNVSMISVKAGWEGDFNAGATLQVGGTSVALAQPASTGNRTLTLAPVSLNFSESDAITYSGSVGRYVPEDVFPGNAGQPVTKVRILGGANFGLSTECELQIGPSATVRALYGISKGASEVDIEAIEREVLQGLPAGAEISLAQPVEVGRVQTVSGSFSTVPLAAGLANELPSGATLRIDNTSVSTSSAATAGSTSVSIGNQNLTLSVAGPSIHRRVLLGTVRETSGDVTQLTVDTQTESPIHAGSPMMVGKAPAEAHSDIAAGVTVIPVRRLSESPAAGTTLYVSGEVPGYALRKGSTQFTVHPGNALNWIQNGQATGPGHTPTCQWVADAPGKAYQFDGQDDYLALDATKVEQVATAGNLTLEAWVKPHDVSGTDRILHHHSSGSSYTLGLKGEDLMSALALDGDGDYVEVGASLLNGLSAFTIEGWVKPTATPGSLVSLFGQNDLVELGFDGSKMKVRTSGGGSAECTHGIPNNEWHHVALTGDGKKLRLYVDGVEKASGGSTVSSNYGSSSDKFQIGAGVWSGGSSNPLTGHVDEIRVWNHARKAADLATDRHRRLGGHEPGLIGYWFFEKGMAIDQSGRGNHGTVKGNPGQAASPLAAYRVFTGIGERFAQSTEVIPCRSWNHLAVTYHQSYALQFGERDYLDCGKNMSLDIPEDLTLEVFLEADRLGTRQGILSKGILNDGSEQSVPYALYLEADGKVAFTFEDGEGRDHTYRSSVPLAADRFAKVAVTRKREKDQVENKETKILDGKLIFSTSASEGVGKEIDGSSVGNNFDLKQDGKDTLEITIKTAASPKWTADDQYSQDYVIKKEGGKINVYRGTEQQVLEKIEVKEWDRICFFVNDQAAGEHKFENRPFPIGHDKALQIGRVHTLPFTGSISEVRIWDQARDAKAVNSPLQGNESGLVSWWRLDENEGNVAFDSKGDNNAKIEGAQWIKTPDPVASPLHLYCNGNLIDWEAIPDTDSIVSGGWGSQQLSLGCRQAPTISEKFHGDMEEVRIWSLVRTQEQLLDNLFTRLKGEKQSLLANYTFDASNATRLEDDSLLRNHLSFGAATTRPTSVLSTAPISNDAAQVRSALAGVKTNFHELISCSPAVAEYGDMQVDSQGNMGGVMKRCYAYIQDGQWRLITGYKVGNLITEWIGQAQYDPQVMGYIEGAPPVPSENFTVGALKTGVGDYSHLSTLEVVEADNVNYSFSASRQSSFDSSFGLSAGIGGNVETEFMQITAPLGIGVGVTQKIMDLDFTAKLAGKLETSTGWSSDSGVGATKNLTQSTSVSMGGNWESPNNLVNSELGQRFQPGNMGFALVQSETADIFALRLAHNYALVSFRMQPNPDIPKDWNIIPFPINPRYTKQGTLDGGIGFDQQGKVVDPDYPMARSYGEYSYFKPIEAYRLKRRIRREEQQLTNYYESFDTDLASTGNAAGATVGGYLGGPLGAATGAAIGGLIQGLASDTSLPKKIAKKNIVNTYVWTADGGFFAESTETSDTRSETTGGSFKVGGAVDFGFGTSFDIFGLSVAAEFNASLGGSLTKTRSKSQSSDETFSLSVNVGTPGDLQKYNTDGSREYDSAGNAVNVPGKVDAYRFMTFYLDSDKSNFEDLFSKVMDPIWLEQSSQPNAIAMRQARQSTKVPPCWRVLHRVTFVSRLLPEFPSATAPPLEKAMKTQNIDSNWQLIQRLEPYVRNKTDSIAEFADSVHSALSLYLPELLPHEQQILSYLALYYGVEGMS